MKRFEVHKSKVNDISIDHAVEFIASCSDDGSAAVSSPTFQFSYSRHEKDFAWIETICILEGYDKVVNCGKFSCPRLLEDLNNPETHKIQLYGMRQISISLFRVLTFSRCMASTQTNQSDSSITNLSRSAFLQWLRLSSALFKFFTFVPLAQPYDVLTRYCQGCFCRILPYNLPFAHADCSSGSSLWPAEDKRIHLWRCSWAASTQLQGSLPDLLTCLRFSSCKSYITRA